MNKDTTSKQTSKEWQTEFAQSLFNGLSAPLAADLSADSSTEQQQRFAVYQNNVFYSLTNALADLYPSIKRLVGDDFFNGTANAYIRAHPPKQAAMVNFGWDFAEFLSNFKHTQSLPYLSDIAYLELARHQAYHAADTAALDNSAFTNINPVIFEQATLEFHPSLRLIESHFPIFTVWQSNQASSPQSEQSIRLDEPQWVVVVRLHHEVLTFSVDYGTYLFYKGLQGGQTVSYSANESQVKYPDIDISSAILLGITNGFITRIIT